MFLVRELSLAVQQGSIFLSDLHKLCKIEIQVRINPRFYRFGEGMDQRAFSMLKVIYCNEFLLRIDDPVFPNAILLIE